MDRASRRLGQADETWTTGNSNKRYHQRKLSATQIKWKNNYIQIVAAIRPQNVMYKCDSNSVLVLSVSFQHSKVCQSPEMDKNL